MASLWLDYGWSMLVVPTICCVAAHQSNHICMSWQHFHHLKFCTEEVSLFVSCFPCGIQIWHRNIMEFSNILHNATILKVSIPHENTLYTNVTKESSSLSACTMPISVGGLPSQMITSLESNLSNLCSRLDHSMQTGHRRKQRKQ